MFVGLVFMFDSGELGAFVRPVRVQWKLFENVRVCACLVLRPVTGGCESV